MSFRPDLAGLERVLATIPDIVVLVDRDRIVRYINRAEPGYAPEQVVGLCADQLLDEETGKLFREAMESMLATGEEVRYEMSLVTPDGTTHWYSSRLLPLGPGGPEECAVLIATNITELKTAQQAAERFRELLPMCAWCDNIQNEDGEWEEIETYLGRETSTRISHGLCPGCHAREMEELAREDAAHDGRDGRDGRSG